MLRIESPLDEQTEEWIRRGIGCCIAVHSALCPGLLERVYTRALEIEFGFGKIPYERERRAQIYYREQLLCAHRLDLVIANRIVLEVKGVERLQPVHHAQLLGYLRTSKLRVGLLVNFNVAVLRDGIKRIVL
jgi:GxxExxY protein